MAASTLQSTLTSKLCATTKIAARETQVSSSGNLSSLIPPTWRGGLGATIVPAPRSSVGKAARDSRKTWRCRGAAAEGDAEADRSNDSQEAEGSASSGEEVSSQEFRQRMEALVENQGKDEAYFDGKELARLIFDKFGRSYDVTFLRQEFMGRKLLAMNIMWKYREQKSFPLSEAEYLTRLDLVAETLRFWGAVGLVRESLAATKERPRIGKAVSIRIDLDESGERSREWINR